MRVSVCVWFFLCCRPLQHITRECLLHKRKRLFVLVEGLAGRGCVHPCVRVSGNQEEPPGSGCLVVCVSTHRVQEKKNPSRPDSGREGRKFLCWSAATRRGCFEARGLEFEGFPGKIRHHQAHRKCRESVCECLRVCASAISGKQSGTSSPRITLRLVKTPTPLRERKNRINFCSVPSNRISTPQQAMDYLWKL